MHVPSCAFKMPPLNLIPDPIMYHIVCFLIMRRLRLMPPFPLLLMLPGLLGMEHLHTLRTRLGTGFVGIVNKHSGTSDKKLSKVNLKSILHCNARLYRCCCALDSSSTPRMVNKLEIVCLSIVIHNSISIFCTTKSNIFSTKWSTQIEYQICNAHIALGCNVPTTAQQEPV